MKDLFKVAYDNDGNVDVWINESDYDSKKMDDIMTGCLLLIADVANHRFDDDSAKKSMFLIHAWERVNQLCDTLDKNF